jgi:hypothetical protein
MRIPSSRTRRDMEMAAELRASGGTWDTVARQLGRQPNVVMRWVKEYPQEWERMFRDAEARASRDAGNESRTALRILLRHQDSKLRLHAAECLAKLRLAEKAADPPPDPRADLNAMVAQVEQMSDDELQQFLAEFVKDKPAA